MDFKNVLADFLTAFIITVKRFFLLIIFPYRTMRKISFEKDRYQLIVISVLIFLYFKFIYFLRDKPYPATFLFIVFLTDFLLTISFFYLLTKVIGSDKNRREISFSSFIFTFAYTLFPTLIWFLSTSFLYIVLPPPRTLSILGKGFSIFFVAFSLSLLIWKLILVYLAVRFSSKQNFFKIFYMLILYLAWYIPCSIILYNFRLFRVPFI
jgi:hypothetical protein